MNGWLVINKYHISDSFTSLVDLLLDSARNNHIDLNVIDNIDILNLLATKKYIKPDFVLFWDKDIKLAKYLETEDIKVFNSSDSIRICDDKSLTYLYLRNAGIKMPKTIFSPLIYFHNLYEDKEFMSFIFSHLKFPFVFKECFGSFGNQVYLIQNESELIEKIKICEKSPFEIQEFINTSFGRDLRIYVVGNDILGGMLRTNENGDFRANIEIGGKGKRYDLNQTHIDLVKNVISVLKLDFAGIDILFGESDEPILCEVNSNAYFISYNKTLNVNVADYIIKYIKEKVCNNNLYRGCSNGKNS